MKIASFLVTALFAAQAFSYTAVFTDYSPVLHDITLKNACVTATEVKSITAQQVCTKLVPHTYHEADNTYTEWTCEAYAMSQLSYPRAFERTVCTNFDNSEAGRGCLATAQKAEFMPSTISVRYETTGNGESEGSSVTKSFTFPSCQ